MACLPAALPPDLAAPLQHFRADAPHGWSYTQTTIAEGRSTVERHDAAMPAFARWSLIQKDGRQPTPVELREYNERRSRWSRTGTAPNITDQLDPRTLEIREESRERIVFRARLKSGEGSDRTARFLRITITVHKPTQSIESLELASVEAFNPTLGVKISEMRTTMTYMLPSGETPALPLSVTTRVRGRAFLFKSLDADMTVTYSDYDFPYTRPGPRSVPAAPLENGRGEWRESHPD